VSGSCEFSVPSSQFSILSDTMPFLRTENRTENSLGFEDKPSWLFSHHFNDDSFVALAVEFGVEDLLPGAEV